MEKALPGQVSTSLGEEPRQLPPDPMPLLLPITTPEVLSGFFAASSKTTAGLQQEKGAKIRTGFLKIGKPASSHFQLTDALGSH